MENMNFFTTTPLDMLQMRQQAPSNVSSMEVLQQEKIKERIVPCVIKAIKNRYKVLTDDEALSLWDRYYNEVILSDEY